MKRIKYINLFETKNEYDNAFNELPYVSLNYISETDKCKIINTVISDPTDGPANNEIWYTSTDGNTINGRWLENNSDNNIVSNTYENGKGIITFNQDITYIIYGAFQDCFNLLQVIIPNSITKIRYAAFYNCYSLTEITIPNSVLEIEYAAFLGCENLKYIKYDGYKKDWYKIQLGYQWNYNVPCETVQCLDGDIYLNEYYGTIGVFDEII